ncbi:hypothetical protein E0H68_37295 [Rhizobium leguminosarum bv. viciae]|uniref:restriction endonuclease subunit S n=1 Tax=Rhizobium leguminosarum TaxID=384 RepID=UPI00103D489B|nr:restriction endonuclease subunit S [Rhizobium leguminosarum]TBZ50380.1 hypothetical protein E0H44_06750 [Rhizobium leguminosarum bv. viciae]TCA01178.1 hypothetical protein E0H68_37295 [Rhizobium leguminosarum bv. viciae]
MRQTSLAAVGDLCSVVTKGTTPTTLGKQFQQIGIPFLRAQNVAGGQVILDDELLFIDEPTHRTLARSVIERGDVLVTIAGTIGRAAEVPIDAPAEMNCNQAVAILRPTIKVNRSYLRHWLESANAQQQIFGATVTGTISNLSLGQIRSLQIPLPPLDEQKRIAAILDKADQLRQKRRQAIALLESLTRLIFLEMFGDLVENDKSFAAGRISDWVEDFETGKNLAPDPDNSDPLSYRVLKVSAVTSGIFKAEEAKALPKSYRAPLNHLIHRGDLLFSRANTAELIGATAMVNADYERIVLPDKIWRFAWNAKNKPNPLFVHGMFSSSSFRGEISKRATGTSGSMKNISKEKVLNIHIGMPERQLQDDFAERIKATQRCRLACENQLNVLEAHFSSLQHRAFSGQL